VRPHAGRLARHARTPARQHARTRKPSPADLAGSIPERFASPPAGRTGSGRRGRRSTVLPDLWYVLLTVLLFAVLLLAIKGAEKL
jgi:hypothetical protein